MQRSKTPVHSGVGNVVPTSGHVPYARLVATHCSPRNHCNWRVLNSGGGNLPTKLARGCAGVQYLYGRDILPGVAMRRHREARSSHLDSPDTVLMSAHRSEQCGYQRGRGCLQSCWKPYLGPTFNSPGQSRRPRDLAALSRAPLPLPMTPGNYGVLLQKAVGGGMFERLCQSLVSL